MQNLGVNCDRCHKPLAVEHGQHIVNQDGGELLVCQACVTNQDLAT